MNEITQLFNNILESEDFKKVISNLEKDIEDLREQGYSDETIKAKLFNKLVTSVPKSYIGHG
ncbi:hypothetical protein O0A22_11600 [Staphylococcus pseudintermedius]|nr:hypothetical protein [Staphylococcus pseudintermedius]